MPVDSSLAASIDGDGFQCYAGFPARRLKVRDLLVFMFRHCWKRDYQAIILCSLVAGIIPLVSLKYLTGISNKEIAELEDMTANNVGVVLHRALDKLKAILEGSGYTI